MAQGLAKSTEAAGTLRSKVSDELLKLRSASSLPVTAEAPGSMQRGEARWYSCAMPHGVHGGQ